MDLRSPLGVLTYQISHRGHLKFIEPYGDVEQVTGFNLWGPGSDLSKVIA